MRKVIALSHVVRDVFREMPWYKAVLLVIALTVMILVLMIKAIQIFIPFTYIAI